MLEQCTLIQMGGSASDGEHTETMPLRQSSQPNHNLVMEVGKKTDQTTSPGVCTAPRQPAPKPSLGADKSSPYAQSTPSSNPHGELGRH